MSCLKLCLTLCFLFLGSLLSSSCRSRDFQAGQSQPFEFVNRNLRGSDFDLRPREFVLTFDDGPEKDTERLVDFLEERQIPAIFFLVGEKARKFPAVVKRIAANPDLFYVANHSMTHTDPLTSSTSFAIDEIQRADDVITRMANPPPRLKFMRPPYGALVGSVARIQGINASSPALAAYIGPVFWDVGGELTATHSADWACWGKVSVDECQQGYLREMAFRGKGIVLLHDVHAKTVDMVTRAGGLVDEMQRQGFKIVNLAPANKVDEFARRFRAVPATPADPADPAEPGGPVETQRPIFFATANRGLEDGKSIVFFKVNAPGATSFEITFDRSDLNLKKQGPIAEFTFPFTNPGSRVISVVARFPSGEFSRATHSFTVAAPVNLRGSSVAAGEGLNLTGDSSESGPLPADVASFNKCFDISKVTVGRTFDLFSGGGSLAEPQSSADVTKSKLRLVSDPVAIGAETWLLRYSRQLNESSSETFDIALSTKTGCIVDGVRQRKTDAGIEESFVRGKFIDCANKVWRGEIYTPHLQGDVAVAQEIVAKDSEKKVSVLAKDEGEAFARREWFTFHADESDDAEPLAAGAGANAGTVCEGH